MLTLLIYGAAAGSILAIVGILRVIAGAIGMLVGAVQGDRRGGGGMGA
jgi:hypothetical protein